MEGSYYHFGVLVRDLAEAIPRYSSMFGCSFARPFDFQTNIADSEARETTVHVTYSQGGPPYIELIEGHDDQRFFRIDLGERLHHIGRWEDDLDSRVKELEAQGYVTEATMTNDSGLAVWFGMPQSLHGTRVELVSSRSRDGLLGLIESAPAFGA